MIGRLHISMIVNLPDADKLGKFKKVTLASLYCDRDDTAEKLREFKATNSQIDPHAIFAHFTFEESVRTRD